MTRLQFFSMRQFQAPPNAKVYRQRAWTAALWLALMGGFSIAMLYVGWRGGLRFNNRGDGIPPFIGWAIGVTWGLVSWWIFGTALKARLKPSNWLVMLGSSGLHVKYRSPMNAHFPQDDEQIFFLPFAAIGSARLHRHQWLTPASRGGSQMHRATFVELRLVDADDAALLAEKLAAERAAKGPRIKTWYGSKSLARWSDYPVQASQASVAIHWRVHPGAQRFLDDIAGKVALGEAAQTRYDWQEATTPDADAATLRDLAQLGESFAVMNLLQRKSGLSLTEAKQKGEEIRRRK